jgi:hypothetical protein
MAWIRSTYNSGTVTSVIDSSTLATNYSEWWLQSDEIDNTNGIWHTGTNKFIPDGVYDEQTHWLLESGSIVSSEKINYMSTLDE